MRPRVVFLAGLASVFSTSCLVQPSDTLSSDPTVDTERSALDMTVPAAPSGGESSGDPATGEQPGLEATPTRGFAEPVAAEDPAEDPGKPSPDPWDEVNFGTIGSSGVAVSPNASKSAK